MQDFVCEVASCLYKHCLFLTDNQPEIHSRYIAITVINVVCYTVIIIELYIVLITSLAIIA